LIWLMFTSIPYLSAHFFMIPDSSAYFQGIQPT